MPISFDLEAIRVKHDCKIYFETGMWDPRTEISCKKALRSNFDKVFNIELRNDWYEMAKDIFKSEIDTGRLTLINDDSNNMANHLDKDTFKDKAIFFLDAHVDNIDIKNYKNRCPLFNELNAIKNLTRNDNIILVDDLRLIRQPFPWGEQSYGNIDFFESIKSLIISINPNYKFEYLDGHCENDVLYAYV